MIAVHGLTAVPMIEYEDTDDCVAVQAPHVLPGKFGVRVEDLAAITETGCEVLTRQ